jgi:hypothetical protein
MKVLSFFSLLGFLAIVLTGCAGFGDSGVELDQANQNFAGGDDATLSALIEGLSEDPYKKFNIVYVKEDCPDGTEAAEAYSLRAQNFALSAPTLNAIDYFKPDLELGEELNKKMIKILESKNKDPIVFDVVAMKVNSMSPKIRNNYRQHLTDAYEQIGRQAKIAADDPHFSDTEYFCVPMDGVLELTVCPKDKLEGFLSRSDCEGALEFLGTLGKCIGLDKLEALYNDACDPCNKLEAEFDKFIFERNCDEARKVLEEYKGAKCGDTREMERELENVC